MTTAKRSARRVKSLVRPRPARSLHVGQSDIVENATQHAFLWRRGVMYDLGTLPGDVYSSAQHISDNGQIAGYSFDANNNNRAVLWSNGRMWDLNTLVPPNSGLFLQEALDINNRGQIAGFGCVKCDGSDQLPFLATPTGKFSSVNVSVRIGTRSADVTRGARNAWQRAVY